MQTGPRVAGGFDLALTELPDGFVLYVGSEAGSEAMRDTVWTAATAYDLGRARTLVDDAERRITREVHTEGLATRLFESLDPAQRRQPSPAIPEEAVRDLERAFDRLRTR